MKKITKDWLDSADCDLELIGEISSQVNLTHLSAFHAQQSIEKSYKAIIEEFDLGFVKTHSLEMLNSRIGDKISVDINIDLLILLDQLYIDARYPGEMGLLPNGKPTVSEAQEFYDLGVLIFNAAKSVCK
jgi:HEPN domain-containing protein